MCFLVHVEGGQRKKQKKHLLQEEEAGTAHNARPSVQGVPGTAVLDVLRNQQQQVLHVNMPEDL